MAKQITDDEDRLKRQARRRLIGAVALTTAIVVVLPMVLDNEPKPVGQDIELRIPNKDKVGAFVPKMDLPYTSSSIIKRPLFLIFWNELYISGRAKKWYMSGRNCFNFR